MEKCRSRGVVENVVDKDGDKQDVAPGAAADSGDPDSVTCASSTIIDSWLLVVSPSLRIISPSSLVFFAFFPLG